MDGLIRTRRRIEAAVLWCVAAFAVFVACSEAPPPADAPRASGPAPTHEPAEPTVAETPLEGALRSSGTGARLRAAGLTERSDDTELAAPELGAEASFRAARPDGSAYGDVYYFSDYDELRAAQPRLAELPAPEGTSVLVPANGPFLVRVVARGDAFAVGDIAHVIAGDE